MQIIYRAKDIAEAHILSGYLRAQGVDSHVDGHYLQGAIGEIGMADFALVRGADEDVEKARKLVLDYESNRGENPVHSHSSNPPSPLLIMALFLVSAFLLVMLVS